MDVDVFSLWWFLSETILHYVWNHGDCVFVCEGTPWWSGITVIVHLCVKAPRGGLESRWLCVCVWRHPMVVRVAFHLSRLILMPHGMWMRCTVDWMLPALHCHRWVTSEPVSLCVYTCSSKHHHRTRAVLQASVIDSTPVSTLSICLFQLQCFGS